MAALDEDAIVAAIDLVGRSGATNVEVGYLDDTPLAADARWYAHAQYRGARITIEDQPGPVEAVEALARRILDGGTCAHCHQPVRLGGTEPGCRWTRNGPRWVRGCEATHRAPNRAERRAATRRGGHRR